MNLRERPVVFRIASLVTILINLTFCIVAFEEDIALDLEEKVFDLLHEISGQALSSGRGLGSDPTIRDLLQHIGAFRDLNQQLLSVDGTFMFSDIEEFIDVAAGLSNSSSHESSNS